jgi:hypothetical protein
MACESLLEEAVRGLGKAQRFMKRGGPSMSENPWLVANAIALAELIPQAKLYVLSRASA